MNSKLSLGIIVVPLSVATLLLGVETANAATGQPPAPPPAPTSSTSTTPASTSTTQSSTSTTQAAVPTVKSAGGCPGRLCPRPPTGRPFGSLATQHYQAPGQGGWQSSNGSGIAQAFGFIHQSYGYTGSGGPFGYCPPRSQASMVSPSVQGTIMQNSRGHMFVSPLFGGVAAYEGDAAC